MVETELEAHEKTRPTASEELDHKICNCDADTSFCGLDVSMHPWGWWLDPIPNPCAVCFDTLACPQCGRAFPNA